MFTNLKKVLEEKHINNTTLAKILGVDAKSIFNKLSGMTEWKLSEIRKIQELCPEYSMEWLFATEEQLPA